MSAGKHQLSCIKACVLFKTGLAGSLSNPPSSATQVAGIKGVKYHTASLIKVFEDSHEYHVHLFPWHVGC